MKQTRFPAAVLLAALLICGAAADADQDHPALPELFSSLQNATNPMAAAQAEQTIWRLWNEAPSDAAREMMLSARGAADVGDYDEAKRLLDALVTAEPRFAEAWNQRAIFRFMTADFEGSLDDISQTLKLEPRHFGALAGRGQCLMHLERPAEALAAFEAALSVNPWMQSIEEWAAMLRTMLNATRPSAI